MCGLFGGFSSTLIKAERETVGNLGIINYFRGKDSAGHFDYMTTPPGKENNCIYHKSMDSILDYIQDEWPDNEEKRWSKGQGMKIIAGHARAATKGTICKENAHPFAHGYIVGMHNGTIHGEFANSKKFETDSEALIHNIADMGIEDAIQEVNASAFGNPAYALVWVDSKKGTLNFLRNELRSLSYAKEDTKNSYTIFWNSEMLPMSYVLNRDNPNKWKIFSFEANHHYAWDIDKGPNEAATKTEIKSKPKVYTATPGFMDWPKKETSVTLPGVFRERTKSSFPHGAQLDRKWIIQYSASRKTEFYKYYDAPTGKYFSEWSFKRLTESRMFFNEGTSKANHSVASVADNTLPFTPDTHTGLNDNAKTEDKAANFWSAMCWTVYKGRIVSWEDWLMATKRGCCYCSKTLTLHADVFWAGENEPVCYSCCEKVLKDDKSEEYYFFEQHTDDIRKFLRDRPDYLKEELALNDKYLAEMLKDEKQEYAE